MAQRCFVAKSGVSILVTRMAKDKLLQRQADAVDARVWRLFLTPAGLALAEKTHKLQATVVAAMAKGSKPGERTIVNAVMQRACATLEDMLHARVD